jgi:serine/threonine protein kinase
MKVSEVVARFQAWLKEWGLRLLLASCGLGSKSAQEANTKTIHDKNANKDLLDLTKQISKESSRYPVAQGSFGDVWKCIRKHPQITVEVAVKCLRLEIPNDNCKTKITERLEHDLQRNTQLKHANLLPLLGITQGFGPLPAIVSPWMHKGSLTMLLERDFQQLTLTRMLQILKDVASALQYRMRQTSVFRAKLT